mmetsp:Transcript_21441/g.59544  ORF Transcript_21441/g.59544 Transcript_21441/m.59544 type:complete len:301 (+) Transcript_21441:1488-2390(+)
MAYTLSGSTSNRSRCRPLGRSSKAEFATACCTRCLTSPRSLAWPHLKSLSSIWCTAGVLCRGQTVLIASLSDCSDRSREGPLTTTRSHDSAPSICVAASRRTACRSASSMFREARRRQSRSARFWGTTNRKVATTPSLLITLASSVSISSTAIFPSFARLLRVGFASAVMNSPSTSGSSNSSFSIIMPNSSSSTKMNPQAAPAAFSSGVGGRVVCHGAWTTLSGRWDISFCMSVLLPTPTGPVIISGQGMGGAGTGSSTRLCGPAARLVSSWMGSGESTRTSMSFWSEYGSGRTAATCWE